jgi:hypothetical protein
VVQPGGGLLFGMMFGLGLSLAFCRAGFEMFVDLVLEPVIWAVIATTRFEWRRELVLLNKSTDVLAAVLDALRFEVRITDDNSSHRDALS